METVSRKNYNSLRIKFIAFKEKGKTLKEIAAALNVRPNTVTEWNKKYKANPPVKNTYSELLSLLMQTAKRKNLKPNEVVAITDRVLKIQAIVEAQTATKAP